MPNFERVIDDLRAHLNLDYARGYKQGRNAGRMQGVVLCLFTLFIFELVRDVM